MTSLTDTSERGLERLICTALAGSPCVPAGPRPVRRARPAAYGNSVNAAESETRKRRWSRNEGATVFLGKDQDDRLLRPADRCIQESPVIVGI